MNKLCILGDILIDYTITPSSVDDKMRLGGIFHAARGAWAMDIDYELAYFAPSYLDTQVASLTKHHNGSIIKIGNIEGAPNVILIKEAKEVANQGYELILRDERKYLPNNLTEFDKRLLANYYSEILVFTNGADLQQIFNVLSKYNLPIHLDISNDIEDFGVLKSLNKKFETIFLSTSSVIFKKTYTQNIELLKQSAAEYCNTLVFKENRGGSRCFTFNDKKIYSVSSQTRKIIHSVGVGDNYDIAFINKIKINTIEDSLSFASWVAMEYASTTYPEDYKKAIKRLNNVEIETLKNLSGITIPWEDRKQINIYIAAPDFDYVKREPIDLIENALKYHNFSPRLPVREHGQLSDSSSEQEKLMTCNKDISLLYECQLLIVVLLFNDPGTLIEMGLAISSGIDTIVYDPYNQAKNCILTKLPLLVSTDLDEIISQVFISSSKIKLS